MTSAFRTMKGRLLILKIILKIFLDNQKIYPILSIVQVEITWFQEKHYTAYKPQYY